MSEFGIKEREMDDVRLPRATRVKNKQPADKQVRGKERSSPPRALRNALSGAAEAHL